MIEKIPKQNTWGQCLDKINELVDAVNILQAQVAILEEHAHPTAKTEPAENVLTKSLRMDKEFAENECVRLQNELERTHKALEVALAELQEIDGVCDDNKYTDNLYVGLDGQDTRNIALDVKKTITQIKALVQKE